MRTLYAEVVIDIASDDLDRPFNYRVPEEMAGILKPGMAVSVPFGNGQRRGYCLSVSDVCHYDPDKVKPITAILTDSETVDSRLIALAAYLAGTYGGPLSLSLKTVFPLRRKMAAVKVRHVRLADEEAALAYKARLRKTQKARAAAIDALCGGAELTTGELAHTFGVSAEVLKGLVKDGIVIVTEEEQLRGRLGPGGSRRDPLSPVQQAVTDKIRAEWETGQKRPVVLKGITGSGKTMIYMELIADCISRGQQAIVLIPEIALTRQTVRRFSSRFGSRVAFLHSRLSEGERYDQMKAARKGLVDIMVGPRSALFTPFPNLGLIVMDEEHEETYRSEKTPRYHARETAEERARLENARFIMGSATPSVTAWSRTETGEYLGLALESRFGDAGMAKTYIADMRDELARGNRTILSDRLREELGNCLARGEQAMLFLNRRGYAGFVSCRQCGFVARCPHCDVSLTRHMNGRLICHYCGYSTHDLTVCPSCGSRYIGGLTIGTEQVEELVGREFPSARILRMDMDTTRGKEGHGAILSEFEAGEADILVGTQMIVKGHDFPNVTLMGILMADMSLNADSYRSQERTFQLITQAVGRAGRGGKAGLAVIQTYEKEHFAIQAAAAQDYDRFYQEEMAFRRLMAYPPAGSMMAVLGSAAGEETLSQGMHFLRQYIERIDPAGALRAIGPAPQTVGKIRDRYRQVIYLRHRSREALVRARNLIERYIEINSGFSGITIEFDFHQ